MKSFFLGSPQFFFEQHVAFGASEAGVGMCAKMSQVHRQADCHSLNTPVLKNSRWVCENSGHVGMKVKITQEMEARVGDAACL